ncbi:MAG TPA: hypothetical protein VFV15_00515, partial [Moraxellaceae bacterium]|nr:hypothetical protein [Moraxellaceae bacterium]
TPLRLEDLETGDIVLFSGRGLSARLVQGVTGSYWSHVGLVLRLPGRREPLLWESTRASAVVDVRRGVPLDGVQLVSLAVKLADYPGEVAARRLLDAGAAHARYRRMRPLLRAWHAWPYRNFLTKALRAWWSGEEDGLHGAQGGFCSELVAEVYQQLGLLSRQRPSRAFVPRDFGPEAGMQLCRGRLSPVGLLQRV